MHIIILSGHTDWVPATLWDHTVAGRTHGPWCPGAITVLWIQHLWGWRWGVGGCGPPFQAFPGSSCSSLSLPHSEGLSEARQDPVVRRCPWQSLGFKPEEFNLHSVSKKRSLLHLFSLWLSCKVKTFCIKWIFFQKGHKILLKHIKLPSYLENMRVLKTDTESLIITDF